MKLEEIAFFIDVEIKKQYKSRRQFAIATGRSYEYFTDMLSGAVTGGQDVRMSTIVKILEDLNCELIVQKKEPTKK